MTDTNNGARVRQTAFAGMMQIVTDTVNRTAVRAVSIEPEMQSIAADGLLALASIKDKHAAEDTPLRDAMANAAMFVGLSSASIAEHALLGDNPEFTDPKLPPITRHMIQAITQQIREDWDDQKSAVAPDEAVMATATARVLLFSLLNVMQAPTVENEVVAPPTKVLDVARILKLCFPEDWLRAMLAMAALSHAVVPMTDEEYAAALVHHKAVEAGFASELAEIESESAALVAQYKEKHDGSGSK